VAQGSIKWFSREKGYGFVEDDEGGDVFVHFSAVSIDSLQEMKEGRRVEFDVVAGERGPQADAVRAL
jgi:CspA family cold shock protein